MSLARGDVVVITAQGDCGKPRPAVVMPSDVLNEAADSVIVCPFTSEQVNAPLFRLEIAPAPENGLRGASYLMVDRIAAVRRRRVGDVIGKLGDAEMEALNRRLILLVLDLAG